jgi:tRNA nucleotidyltransferase (CCA-adding enzyme)
MADYNFLLEIRLSPPQFQTLNHISRIAAGLGINLYLAGGAVRDVTMGHTPVRDLNFVIDGNVQRLFRAIQAERTTEPRKGGTMLPRAVVEIESSQFDAHGHQAVISFANGVQAEIVMTRRQIYSKPGHPPEILSAGIFDDLRGRDFSVNAMAISLHPNSRGLLLDPNNGAADIENRELRALHSRTFFDDPSRIYRLIRLALRLGFKVEARTQAWLNAALEAKSWEQMTTEQQGRELRDLLHEENPWRVLRSFVERGLVAGLDQTLARIRADHWDKARPGAGPPAGNDRFVLHFEHLAEKLPSAQKKRLARKIIQDPATLRLSLNLEGEARKLARDLRSPKAATPSSRYTLLASKPKALLFYMLSHYPQVRIQKPVKDFIVRYPQIREKLPRAELHALGVEPGPRAEKILNDLFMAVLDGEVKSRPQMLKALHEAAGVKNVEPTGTQAERTKPRSREKKSVASLAQEKKAAAKMSGTGKEQPLLRRRK